MTLLKMSFSATILILAIVIIRVLMLHKLPKKTFLVLWGVTLCRLLIPFSIPSQLSVYTIAESLRYRLSVADTLLISVSDPTIVMVERAINPVLVGTMGVKTSPVISVWMIGLLGCALFFLVTHIRCRREYKTALPVDNELVKDWKKDHPTRRKVEIRQSDKISAPLTYGLFRPVVLLPKITDWTDETRLRVILTHEYVHIRRFDILSKWLLATALCIHWFNPFVWVMYVLANRDIELSCDETVVRTFGETIKSAYALTLIGLEEKKNRLTPLVNNFSKNAIEERIVSIMKIKKISLMGMMLAFVLVAGTITVFVTNAAASGGKHTEITTEQGKQSNSINNAINIDGVNIDYTEDEVLTAASKDATNIFIAQISDKYGVDMSKQPVTIQFFKDTKKGDIWLMQTADTAHEYWATIDYSTGNTLTFDSTH